MAKILYDRLNEIKTRHLSLQSVTGEKIASDAIEEKHIRDGSVTREKIADGMIGPDELTNSAVTAAKLASNSVTTEKVANQAITGPKIQDDSITNEKIADNAISTAKIRDGAITQAKLSFVPPSVARPITPAVATDEIGANAVGSSQLAVDSVSSEKLQANAVTSAKIEANAVVTEKLQDGCVTQEKLAPGVGGDRFVFLTPATVVLYLTSQSSPIPETEIDLSAIIPAGAKAVIARAQIYTESATGNNAQFIMHLRKPGIGGEPSVRVGQLTATSREAENDGFCPVDVNRRITYQVETGPGTGNTVATFAVVVTAYVM